MNLELPPELLDEIISHVPLDGEESLRNCSLVAKSWIHPSRRRLFESVDIWGNKRSKLWFDTISPTNSGVLQHVRSLFCQITDASHSPGVPTSSFDLIRDYSLSFRQLRRLTLFSGYLPSFTQIGTTPTFQRTLSHLCLWCCHVTVSALVTFVNYFPSLARLDLVELSHKAGGQPAPPFSRPLEKLSITEFGTDGSLGLLDQLMELRPECDQVTVGVFWSLCPSLAQRVVDGVEASIKCLSLESDLAGSYCVPKIPY